MSAEIIQFGKPNTRTRPSDVIAPCVVREAERPIKIALTATAKNLQTRNELKQAWRKASATTGYWHALLRFHDAVSIAARERLREARSQEHAFSDESRWHVLDSYREAVRRQIFTAAPDIAAVLWKRAHFEGSTLDRRKKRAYGTGRRR